MRVSFLWSVLMVLGLLLLLVGVLRGAEKCISDCPAGMELIFYEPSTRTSVFHFEYAGDECYVVNSETYGYAVGIDCNFGN